MLLKVHTIFFFKIIFSFAHLNCAFSHQACLHESVWTNDHQKPFSLESVPNNINGYWTLQIALKYNLNQMPRSRWETFSISSVEVPRFHTTCKSNFEISISCTYKHLSRTHDTSQDKLSIQKHLHLQLCCIKTREIINEYLKSLPD